MAIGTTAAILGAAGLSTAGGLIANNQANKAAQAAANAAQIDPVEQARQSLELQMQYAPQILALEQQLQPGYAQLSNQILQQQLIGQGSTFDAMGYFRTLTPEGQRQVQAEAQAQGKSINDWLTGHIQTQAANGEQWSTQALQDWTKQDPNSLLGIYQAAQPALSNLQATANTAQRQADIADVENLGTRAANAYRTANPQLTAATDALSQRISAARNVTPGATPTQQATTRDAAATTAGPAAMASQTLAQGSPLLGQLTADAGQSLNSSTPLQAELQRQAMTELQTGGRLSASAARDAEQAVRAAAADRGMTFSNSTIFGEALNKDALVRQRQAEARNLALTVDAAGQQQLAQNRDYALGVADRGTALDTFNAGQANSLAATNAAATNQQNQFNAGLLTSTDLANAAAFNATSQFNAGQGNQMAQFNAELSRALQNDQYGREFALTQMLQSQAIDPYSLVLGRGTGTTAANAVAQAGSMQTGPQYSTIFDPTVSSIANFNANANAAAGNARANNFGALSGSLFNIGGDLLGSYFGG